MGGVINMITREPSDPVQVGVSLSGGSLGSVDGRVDLGTRWKKLTFFTDLESHRGDAYSLIPGDRTSVGPNFERNDIFTKLRYTLTDRAVLGFSATAYHNHQTGLNNSTLGLTLGTSNDSTQSYAATGDFILTKSTTLQARAYSSRYDENSRTNYADSNAAAFGFANLNERYHRLDATVSQQIGSWQLLQGGVEWVQDLYRGANRLVGDKAGQQITTNDFWLEDRLQPFSRLTVTLGGRLQNHSRYGNHLVPKVGVVYRLTDHVVLRGSYGKGFRAPDLGQLYYRFANPASFYQVIGNPNLRTETSESYSAGAWYQRSRFRLGLHLYRHNLNDLIDTYTIGTPQTPAQVAALLSPYGIPLSFNPLLNRLTFVYLNLNRARTEGLELDGDVAILRNVRLAGAYTLLEGVDRATGLALPQRHRHHGYLKAEYNNRRWGTLANLRATFFSKWPLNPAAGTYGYGYQIWDLYASKRLPAGIQAFGAIDNLADSTDRKLNSPIPSFDRPDYGRTFRIGLRYSFTRETR
jgi:outer membrane receptor for ferrienterochelin and colicins